MNERRAFEGDVHECKLYGGLRPMFGDEKVDAIQVLAKSRSDRSTGTVFVTIGKSTLVCNGRQVENLAKMLLTHVGHLGLRCDLIVKDGVLSE